MALPAAVIVVQFVMFPLASAVYVTNAPRPELSGRTPADVGLAFSNVTVESDGGIRLSGWYVPSENGSAVLLRHGSGSTSENTLGHALFLAEAGYGVLLTDARGHGASAGRINELGWHGSEDISAWLRFLATRPDIRAGVGVLGLSMGGEEALRAAQRDPRIGAVVSEGAGVSTYGDATARGAHPIARLVDSTMYRTIELLSDAPAPVPLVDAVGDIGVPTLLIASTEATEREINRTYAAVGGDNVELWEPSDTRHTDGLKEHPEEYRSRVLELFNGSLLERSAF
jgi:pimeloyl-ACP methyl ester carboxylesterase